MKSLAFMLAAGCTTPTGAPQTWPPSLGLTVEAVTSGDLDGDGAPEILVFGSGGSSQSGVYRIENRVDLTIDAVPPIGSFSTFVPFELGHPAAASQVAQHVAVVHGVSSSKVDVQSFDRTLAELYSTEAPGAGSTWVRVLAYPSPKVHVYASDGTTIQRIDDDGVPESPLPAPNGGTAWTLAVAATTYTANGTQMIAVATPTALVTAPVPSANATTVAWTSVRSGNAWLGVTAIDLDGDGREEIVGYDSTAHAVCAIDPAVGTPTCTSILPVDVSGTLSISAGSIGGGPNAIDVELVTATASKTEVTHVLDFGYAGPVLPAVTSVPFGNGRGIVVGSGPGTPDVLLVFGSDGSVVCEDGC